MDFHGFNRIVLGQYPGAAIYDWRQAEAEVRMALANRDSIGGGKMVFMSHKTSDTEAVQIARYISMRHGVKVYMAELDSTVQRDSRDLPENIMRAIEASRCFLVHVIDAIKSSMWIGYEVGVAHAYGRPRAKIMFTPVRFLPSVVDVLKSLENPQSLDEWIRRNVVVP